MNVLELLAKDHGPAPLFFECHTGGVERSFTTQVILRNVAKFSEALRSLGVTPGAHVLILPANSFESLEAILAVIHCGAVAVPVGANLGAAGIARIVEDLQPGCCLMGQTPTDEVRELLSRFCAHTVSIEHDYRALRDEQPGDSPPCARGIDDAALLLHTSGSTGKPKRIYRTHGQLAEFMECNHFIFAQYADQQNGRLVLNPILTALPMTHLSGLGYCLEGLYGGTRIYLLQEFDAGLVLSLIERLRCRFLMLVPSLYELLLHELDHQPGLDVSCLRYCVYGGEACPPALADRLERRLGVRPIAAYGLTECVTGIVHGRASLEAGSYKPASCGTHLMGEIRLVDEHGQVSMEQGELWVRNPTVPKRTLLGVEDVRVTDDGWFRTGDLLSRDADGCFYHRGRVDHMFPCNGNNVYPLQIEQILCSYPGVTDACVAPVRNRRGHIVPAALVACASPIAAAELLQLARERGPRYAVPAFIEFTQALPVAPSGKLDRTQVRTRLQDLFESRI